MASGSASVCAALAPELIELAIRPEPAATTGPARLIDNVLGSSRSRMARAEAALDALVRLWRRVPKSDRAAAVAVGRGCWIDAIRRVEAGDLTAAGGHEALDRSLAELAADTADPALAGVAARVLESQDKQAADIAEHALLTRAVPMVVEHIDPLWAHEPERWLGEHLAAYTAGRAPLPLDAAGERLVIAAVLRAAERFAAHRRRGPVAALLLLVRTPPGRVIASRLRASLDTPGDPLAAAVRPVLRRWPAPAMRAEAWRLLAFEPMAAAAIERVGAADDDADHAALLSLAHLMHHPDRARRAAQTRARSVGGRSPLPDAKTLASLSVEARRGLTRVVPVLAASSGVREAALVPLLADEDHATRLGCVTIAEPGMLADLCFDAHPVASRSAALRWSAAGTVSPATEGATAARTRLADRLARMRCGWSRRVATEELRRDDPWTPGVAASRLAARRWRRRDPAGFDTAVRARLAGREVDARGAVELIRRLGLAKAFDGELADLAKSEDERLAASAIAALGTAFSPVARRAVQIALAEGSPRVQSNAIEAVTRHVERGDLAADHPVLYGELVELKNHPHHRVCSTALAALLRSSPGARTYEPAAVERFGEMLADDRLMHRVAGVWLAERALAGGGPESMGPAWEPLARAVASLASDDPDELVRTRASRCARRLLATLDTNRRAHTHAASVEHV